MSPNAIVFDQVFSECIGKTEKQLEIIKDLYELPIIQEQYEVSQGFIHIAQKKKYFIILVLYDGNGRILLEHKEEGFSLPGTSIRKNESTQECITRLSKTINSHIEIAEVLPVCEVSNIFKANDDSYVEHNGIVFIARMRNCNKYLNLFNDSILVSVNQIDINGINKFSNKKIIELVINNFSLVLTNDKYETQDEEIETNQNYSHRYTFHNNCIKPLLKLFDKSKVEMKNHIINYLSKYDKVLDVSCGDDSTIIETKIRKPSISTIIGNDISRSQIELLSKQHIDTNHNVFFTNHNASDLPYKKECFDISLCKNTLHHMPSREAMINLFNGSLECSKEILFVEIENPELTGGLAKFIHKFRYRKFLGDVGGAYLSKSDFKSLIEGFFLPRSCSVDFAYHKTLQGGYMFAYVKKTHTNI